MPKEWLLGVTVQQQQKALAVQQGEVVHRSEHLHVFSKCMSDRAG
jgi:hypothetical protein